MPTTTIKLGDGVHFDGRQIETLTYRTPLFSDIVAISELATDLGIALRLVSRMSGEPFEALQFLTIDDTLIVLEGLSDHLARNQPQPARSPIWPF